MKKEISGYRSSGEFISAGRLFSLPLKIPFVKILLLSLFRLAMIALVGSLLYLSRAAFSKLTFVFYGLVLVLSFYLEYLLLRIQWLYLRKDISEVLRTVGFLESNSSIFNLSSSDSLFDPVDVLFGRKRGSGIPGLSDFLNFFVVEFVFMAAVLLGAMCMIYPAFVVVSWVYPATYLSSLEGCRFRECFRKAQNLTRGKRWEFAGLLAMQTVVMLPVLLFTEVVIRGVYYSPLNTRYLLTVGAVLALLNMIFLSYFSVQWLVGYVLLRISEFTGEDP